MSTATLTSKGQVTIPAAVRHDLHVSAGDRIEFVKVADGRYEVLAATNDISVIKGILQTDKVVTLDEMDSVIRKRAG